MQWTVSFSFILLVGGIAALTQALIDPQSSIPLIGASGGIAGILGAISCFTLGQR